MMLCVRICSLIIFKRAQKIAEMCCLLDYCVGYINDIKATNASVVLADAPAFEKASSFKDISGTLGKLVWAVREKRGDHILKCPGNMLEPLKPASDELLEKALHSKKPRRRNASIADLSMGTAMSSVFAELAKQKSQLSPSQHLHPPHPTAHSSHKTISLLDEDDDSDDDSIPPPVVFKSKKAQLF